LKKHTLLLIDKEATWASDLGTRLESDEPEFKSCSENQQELFQVTPGLISLATLVLCHLIFLAAS